MIFLFFFNPTKPDSDKGFFENMFIFAVSFLSFNKKSIMKKIFSTALFCLILMTSCAKRNDLEPVIKFKTTEGNFTVRLYPETPQHRDNFVKLVESGYYNGVLFHRVIADFMIQAGDPDSRNAGKNKMLGSGDVNYTIPAEIVYPKYYHKKGALAAARQGDDVNPERVSSGAQFYVVKGHVFTDQQLNALEQKNKIRIENELMKKESEQKKSEFEKYYSEHNELKIKELNDSISRVVKNRMLKNPVWKFTEQQRNDYKTIGGTPHLDGQYTVFGEVIDGIEIVSNISKVKTGKFDRPLENVRILEAKRIR